MVYKKEVLAEETIDMQASWNYAGVRDNEDAQKMTSGSLHDLPSIHRGTATLIVLDDDTLFTLGSETLDDKDIGTGSSVGIVGNQIQGPFPVEDLYVSEPQMSRLEHAAKEGDERAFLSLEGAIAWRTRSPEEIIKGIQFALAVGAHRAARRIASLGGGRFPGHKELQKYSSVLKPPKIISREVSPSSDLSANRNWLEAHRGEYQGQWVAIHNGVLLGTELNLRELRSQIDDMQRDKKLEIEEVLFTKVY